MFFKELDSMGQFSYIFLEIDHLNALIHAPIVSMDHVVVEDWHMYIVFVCL